jgi:hypothetical protein
MVLVIGVVRHRCDEPSLFFPQWPIFGGKKVGGNNRFHVVASSRWQSSF